MHSSFKHPARKHLHDLDQQPGAHSHLLGAAEAQGQPMCWPGSPRCVGQSTAALPLPTGHMPSFGAEDLEYGYDNKKVFLPRSITALLFFFFVLPSPTYFLEFLKLVLTRVWEHQQILMLPALPGTSDKRKPRESGTGCTGDCHIDNY